MRAMGQRLRDSLDAPGVRYGLGIRQSDPVQTPTPLFEGDHDWRLG